MTVCTGLACPCGVLQELSYEVLRGTEIVLRQQHRQIVAIVHGLLGLVRQPGAQTQAAVAVAELAAVLEHHMDLEERITFPEFERSASPRDRGLVRSLRREHRDLRERLARISELAAVDGQMADLHTELKNLNLLEAAHARCEEWLVYRSGH